MKIDNDLCKALMSFDAEVRGGVLLTDMKYVLRQGGEKDLQKIRDWAYDLGYIIDYESIDEMEWLPIGIRLLSFLLVIEHFEMDDEAVRAMGFQAPKISSLTRFALGYMKSTKIFISAAPKQWKVHYTVGEVDVKEIDEKKGRAVMDLNNFYQKITAVDPEVARLFVEVYLAGYFESNFRMMFGNTKGEMKIVDSDKGKTYRFQATFQKSD